MLIQSINNTKNSFVGLSRCEEVKQGQTVEEPHIKVERKPRLTSVPNSVSVSLSLGLRRRRGLGVGTSRSNALSALD